MKRAFSLGQLVEKGWLSYGDGNYSSKYPKASELLDIGIIPFISGKNLRNGRVTNDSMRYISPQLHSQLQKGHIKEGDTLLVTRAGVGAVAFVTSEFDNANINAQLVYLRPDGVNIDANYLYQLFSSPDMNNQLISYSSGSAQGQLPIKALLKVVAVIPDIDEQKKIAGILGTIDEKTQLNHGMNETLNQMGQALFDQYFISNQEAKKVHLGELSTETSERIGDINQQGYVILSAVKTGELVASEEYFTKQVFSKDISKYKKVRWNEFAYNPARVNIGSIGMLDREIQGAVSPVYVTFKAKNNYQNVIGELLKLPSTKKRIVELCSGTVRQILRFSDFCRLSAYKVDDVTLQEFNNQYIAIQNLKQQKLKETEDLVALRDTILPRIISGKIKI